MDAHTIPNQHFSGPDAAIDQVSVCVCLNNNLWIKWHVYIWHDGSY